jgi:hypothetical protein
VRGGAVTSLALPALMLLGVVAGAQDPRGPDSAAADRAAEAPPPVNVVATASKDEVTVGETFTIELKATGPPGTTYRFPSGASEEQIELRTPEPEESSAGEGASASEPGTHRYEAAVFALGDVEIPSLPVRFTLPDGTEGEAASDPIALNVTSLLPRNADEQKLADIRAPRAVGIGRAFWFALVAAVLLGATLVTWLLRRRRPEREPAKASTPETPPDVEALAALRALAASGLLEARAFREFYIRLTTVAKSYLERRLGAPVLEMTTAETLAFLRHHAHGGELLPVVRDLAQAADQIKFARGEGLVDAAEGHLAAVKSLVRTLEARLRPAPPQGGAGEGKAA